MATAAPKNDAAVNAALGESKQLGQTARDQSPSAQAGSGGSATTPGSSGTVVGTGVQQQADAQIRATLAAYGLDSLADWAWQKVLTGESIDQIVLELRQTPEYQARFPAMGQLAKQGMAMSEAQYIDLERSYKQILHSGGLPTGFYDSAQQLGQFMLNNVSPSELSSRVQDYQTVAFNTPPEVRQQLQDLYGIQPGELTAYFIDPNNALPLIHQRVMGAQVAGAGQLSGYGQLSADQATLVGQAGVDFNQAKQGFQQLGMEKQLFNQLPGEANQQITTDQQLGAQFLGNAQDALMIKQRAQQRLGQFQDAYGYLQSQTQGALGLGQELH